MTTIPNSKGYTLRRVVLHVGDELVMHGNWCRIVAAQCYANHCVIWHTELDEDGERVRKHTLAAFAPGGHLDSQHSPVIALGVCDNICYFLA